MYLIRGLSNLEPFQDGCVLTIGNFDGLHLGHKSVIEKLAERGRMLNLPVVVMTFEPQPLEYFLASNAPPRLMRLREKVIQFVKLPVYHLVIMKFNRHFADYDAEQFVDDILIKKLNIKHLVVGDDFHFGKARRGNFKLLNDKAEQCGFTLEGTSSFYVEGRRVSSTLIRDTLSMGDVTLAERWLGHSYSISGRVSHGDKRGRTLGYPTANIRLFRKNTPINGVFAVTMTGIGDTELMGVANVGTRPTIHGGSNLVLETHLFDFDQEIYGEYVEVHFRKKVRDEMQFNSLAELQAQIRIDVTAAKDFFANYKSDKPC